MSWSATATPATCPASGKATPTPTRSAAGTWWRASMRCSAGCSVTGPPMPEPDVLVVGSGPVGAAYVRLLTEARPDLDVLIVEAGPVVSDPPGMNLRNIADPAQQERARLLAQGQALPGTDAVPLDIRGTVTA